VDEDRGELVRFEDRRWADRHQEVEWRHRAAVELVRDEPILDVGGGDGLLLRMLAERGRTRATLVDVSPVAVAAARAEGLDAEVGDVVRGLPHPDGSFGTVTALDVLEHLYDPLSALREMARVGRELVLVVPNFHHWRARAQMLVGRTPYQSRPERGHVHWFNPVSFGALVRDAGLVVNAELVQATARLGPFGKRLAKAKPSLFAGSIAVRARPATSSR
jgi:methionine biosynthesis protein MetW